MGSKPWAYGPALPTPWRATLSSDPTEQDLLVTLRANPADEGARLVYADWLEQRGKTLEASFVRHVGDLPAGDPRVGDVDWRRITSRAALSMCERPACPGRWDLLRGHAYDEHTRVCSGCYVARYCATADDVTTAAGAQGCAIAIDAAADADELKRTYKIVEERAALGVGQGTLPPR